MSVCERNTYQVLDISLYLIVHEMTTEISRSDLKRTAFYSPVIYDGKKPKDILQRSGVKLANEHASVYLRFYLKISNPVLYLCASIYTEHPFLQS